MFNDTIVVGTTPITFTRRTPRGNRAVFVPSGDLPGSERRIEIAHEVTSSKRVNSLVKVAKMQTNAITGVIEEASIQIKVVHPASVTETDVQLLSDWTSKFFGTPGNVTKIFNQEQ